MSARTPFAVWFALSAAAFGHAAYFGTNFPYMDEWPTVAALEGRDPVLPWLVEWHNEHLLPVPRAVYWGLYQLTGDLRAGMVFSVAVWAALALGLMRTAATMRGRTALSDVLFPLLLLHPGQGENWVMSYQIGFAFSTGLAGAGLMFGLRGRYVWLAAVAAVLPFCGAHGAAFAGPFALVAAWHRRAAWPFAAVALFGVSLYATHRPPTPDWVPPVTVLKSAAGFAGYEAMGFGPAGELAWPVSAAVPVLLGVSLFALALRVPQDSRSAALGAYLLGAVLLAAVIGVARGRYGMFAVFFHRYAVLSAAVPIGSALLAVRANDRRVPAVLAVLAAVAFPFNARLGWHEGAKIAADLRGCEADLRAGGSPRRIAETYHFRVFNNVDYLTAALDRYAASHGWKRSQPSLVPEVADRR